MLAHRADQQAARLCLATLFCF
uniref:Uncharacterized protein n=1 Tax=Anguilla anguilla TaxID=7936 RepID=A0A0E9T3N6_ANGAN